jgi:phage tail-like protein
MPYTQFNFKVKAGASVLGGFQELSAIEKISGLNKATDVTLKRGVINAPALNDWLKEVREKHPGGRRTVTIEQQNETYQIVARWILRGARPIRHTFGEPGPQGTDVAIEELVLAYERLEEEK